MLLYINLTRSWLPCTVPSASVPFRTIKFIETADYFSSKVSDQIPSPSFGDMEDKDNPKTPPSLPLKTRMASAFLSSAMDLCQRRDGTVNRFLYLIAKLLCTAPNLKPIDGVKTYDITVDPSRDLWFRVYVPTVPAGKNLPVIVFFHSGGFVFLSPDIKPCDGACRRFSREIPAVVVSVNYRLAPEHRYPAQYEDGLDVLRFLDNSNHVLPENADLSGCFLAGSSAGGNIAHHVAKIICDYKLERLKVIGLVEIQPFFGGEERTESEKRIVRPILVTVKRADRFWRAFLPPGEEWNRDYEAVNVSGPGAADISALDFPATIVFVGGFDVLKDWQKRYYQWLKNSGKEAYFVEYPNMGHAFHIFPELKESGMLISEMREFVHNQKTKFSKVPRQ